MKVRILLSENLLEVRRKNYLRGRLFRNFRARMRKRVTTSEFRSRHHRFSRVI